MFLLCYFVSSLKAIFGIFDGHGGQEVGDFASQEKLMAHKTTERVLF